MPSNVQLPLHTLNQGLTSSSWKEQVSEDVSRADSSSNEAPIIPSRFPALSHIDTHRIPISGQPKSLYRQQQSNAVSLQAQIPSTLNSAGSIESPSLNILSEVSGSASTLTTTEGFRTELLHRRQIPESSSGMEGSDIASPVSPQSSTLPGPDRSLADRSRQGFPDSKKMSNEDEKTSKPAWSELKTKAGKERKRLPLACIACRRKKIRCSGEKPACKHCLRSRIPCVYKVTTRKPAPRTDYMTMLDKRLKRMEERVIKIMPDHDQNKLTAIGRASVKPPVSQTLKSAINKKRPAEEAFGTDLNEWAHGTSTGQLARQFPGIDPAENRLLSEGAEHLPSKELQEHLSEVFFDYLYGQSYHVLHKPSFMRKLRAGKVPPVLLLAVCAVSSRFSPHPQVSTEPAFLRGEQWAKPAREIALRRYDEPSITILTVFLILGLHEFGTCQGGRSWMFGGMAMRMAYALQLHREVDHDPVGRKTEKSSELSFTDREIRRRTMWACFLMDRFNSSGTERPTFATEENIKVQLPVKEFNFQMEIPGPTEDLEGNVPNPIPAGQGQIADAKGNMGVAAYLIKVIALWGRVVKYLNLGGKAQDLHPVWHPDSQFSDLKRQAHQFSENLPDRLKYTPEALHNFAAEKLGNQFLYLHISYYQILLFLHKFAIPTAPGSKVPSDFPKDFVNQAAKIAIDAASNISGLLKEALEHLVAAPFAGYCAFASSTVHVWGIFSSNPQLEATSKRDLTYNVKYLSRMKRHWGMFHHMVENLKGIYRQYADWSLQGPSAGSSSKSDAALFQYGDWFDKYPHGVSGTDYEDPVTHEEEESGNAALSQKPDLQSVEDFFHTTSTSNNLPSRKMPRKHTHVRGRNSSLSKEQKTPNVKTESIHGQQASISSQEQQLTNLIKPSSEPQPIMQPQLNPASFPIYQSTFYQQQPNLIGQLYTNNQHLPVSELDRHLVFGAYAQDLSSTSLNHRIVGGLPQRHMQTSEQDAQSSLPHQTPDSSMSSMLWDQSTDFGLAGMSSQGFQDGGASSAWFMPFNLVPPEVNADDPTAPYGPGISEVDSGQVFDTSQQGAQ